MPQRSRKNPENTQPRMMCARIAGPEALVRRFLSEYPVEPQIASREEDGVAIEVVVSDEVLARARERKLKVHVLYDATARGRERQKEVGKGNRFEGKNAVPRGLGIKTKEDGHELP